jgi:hypothetical protein
VKYLGKLVIVHHQSPSSTGEIIRKVGYCAFPVT